MKMHDIGFYFILLSITCVNATHFRGAILTWSPADDGSAITIRFRISWRRSSGANWCDDNTISNSTLIGGGHLQCLSGCTGNVGSLAFFCTDYSTTDDWSSGRNDIIYNVSSTIFSFRFSSCCWISTLQVGADSSMSVLATVDLSVRSDTGRINSSPTVEMPPVLNLQDGCHYNITLPVNDVDGDVVKCRWANGATECANVCYGFTGAVLDEETCIISYNPNGNQGLYAAALQIEDFASKVSTSPLSSIPLQFIVRVYNGDGCDDVPEFIDPTPNDRACFALDVGDNFNVTVTVRGSQLFNRITTLSAVGMVRSNEKQWRDSTWHYIEMNVIWTPTEDDTGQDHTLCFYATDITGVTSETRCINLPVSVSGPTPLRVERIGLSNTWTIIIDQTFSRPTKPAYIKVFETSTNTEIISVDASVSSDVTFDPINRQINVTFAYIFDIDEDYHVTIPSGLVEGFVSCGALSVAVNDSGFWEIEVDCGEHALLNGEVIAPNGTDYPHSVFYSCNIGHDLIGVSNRSCTDNGTWTGSEPFCNVRDCGNFSVPEKGYVSTNSTIYNTRVVFYCDEGYEKSGNSSIYCEHTAVWSSSPPVCMLVDCEHPGNHDNGNVSTPNGTTFGMTAYYSCHLGYDLIGSTDRQCQQDKRWSGTRPFCSPKDCGMLLPPTHGIIDMMNTTVGNTVTYECDEGFILHGDHVRVCLHTAQWNGSEPTCHLADCGPLQSPLNGNVIANGSTYKSVGTFSCDKGYDLNGNSISECQANGSWSSPAHFCIIVDCGVLPLLIKGLYTYTFNTTTYGETLTAECNDGYDLYGSTVRQCMETGDWNGTTTTCVIKDCGSLTNPANGSVSAAATVFGSVATYSCKTGFEIIGGSTITCQTNGSWSAAPPTCQIKDCGTLPPPANGLIYLPLSTYGSFALYICHDEYHIEGGSNNRRCMSDGNWSDEEPVCALTDCGNLTAPMFGDVFYNSTFYNDVAVFKCDPGYKLVGDSVITCQSDNTWSNDEHVCVLKVCGFLRAPKNGLVRASTATYGTIATFTCNEGFDLVGDGILVCTADGVWNGSAPSCKIKDCGSLSSPNNGSILKSDTTFSSQVFYLCDRGFELIGVDNRTCLGNGTWSESDPSCEIKDCGIPLPPENGDVLFSGTVYGSKCFFSCVRGYDFKGVNISLCSEEGVWNNLQTECLIKDCGNLTELYNGLVDVNSTKYSSTAVFSCNLGYSLKGYSNTTCTDTGLWDNDYPICMINDCGNLTSPDDGTVSYSETTYLSTAFYSCNTGYTLVGVNVTECTSSGIWSSTIPHCQIVDCGPLVVPKHGNSNITVTTFGENVNLHCDLGYNLIGDSQRTCLATGIWSGTHTLCKIQDCGTLAAPVGGTIQITNTSYLSTVSYMCNTGYDLKGVSTSHCLENGSWSDSPPSCVIKDCGMLSDIDKGSIYIPFTTYGSVASYICDRGYRAVGDVTRVCKANGNWDGAKPFCELIVCPEMPAPKNGHVEHNSTFFESKMVYSCNPGYTLFGKDVVICKKDGTWSDYGHNCIVKDCGELDSPGNGSIHFNDTTYLSEAVFECNEGFDLIGEESISCESDGYWNGTAPECQIKECELLGAPENGNLSATTVTFGSIAVYSCNIGYNLIGQELRTCLGDGMWSGNIPQCVIKDCGIPIFPTNGNVEFTNTTYGSVSHYVCSEGYDIMGGNMSVCTKHGNWSIENIACVIKDCGELSSLLNGNVYVESTVYESVASYNCSLGHDISGETTRKCLKNGTWSGKPPICVIKDCGSLADPVNGIVYVPVTTYSSYALYLCQKGYHIEGAHNRRCLATGKWSDETPICEQTDCGIPYPPVNGEVNYNETIYGSEAQYVCNTGFELVGNKTVTCGEDEFWSETGQYCRLKVCGFLYPPEDGSVNSSATTFQSISTFSCSNGFDLVGAEVLVCTADGKWNGSIPVCKIRDCGPLSEPENGKVRVNETSFASEALYVCSDGYSLIGDDVRICLSNATWSGTRPLCQIKDCGTPPVLQDGETVFENTTYGSISNYSCDIGYDMEGENTSRCAENGQWDNNETICILKDCGNLTVPVNGEIYLNNSKYSSTAVFWCKEGFTLQGENNITCLETGIWSNEIPFCVIKDCGALSEIENGRVYSPLTTYGAVASYICNEGYQIVGNIIRMCRSDGSWNGEKPFCKLAVCPEITAPENGHIDVNSSMYEEVATITCDPGYTLIGQSVIVCHEDAIWSDDVPLCDINDCGIPPPLVYGTVSYEKTTYGSVAIYKCITGYEMKGEEHVYCSVDGFWNSTGHDCYMIDCGIPLPPTNGNISFDKTTYGSVARYFCITGYEMTGEELVSCSADGFWNDTGQDCFIKDCGIPSPLVYGTVSFENTTYGSVAIYTCITGYEMKGEERVYCSANGFWNSTGQRCYIIDCGIPSHLVYGNVSYENTTYGSVATFNCITGYEVKGEEHVYCSADGIWNSTGQDCTIKDCGYIDGPDNGDVSNGSTTYGSVLDFTCNDGHELQGSNSTTCLENGSWSTASPVCGIRDCGKLPDPEGGKIIQNDTIVGATVMFICNEGHTMIGPETVNCTVNGTWNMDPPTCSEYESDSPMMKAIIGGGVGGSLGFLIVLIVIIAILRRRKANTASQRTADRVTGDSTYTSSYNWNRSHLDRTQSAHLSFYERRPVPLPNMQRSASMVGHSYIYLPRVSLRDFKTNGNKEYDRYSA